MQDKSGFVASPDPDLYIHHNQFVLVILIPPVKYSLVAVCSSYPGSRLMGNSKSNPSEHQKEEDVSTFPRIGTNVQQYDASIETIAETIGTSIENVNGNNTTSADVSKLISPAEHHAYSCQFSAETREQFNTMRRAAYRKKKDDDNVSLQKENHPSFPKSDHKDLINARRRASYLKNKNMSDGSNIQEDDEHCVSRRALCDVTNLTKAGQINRPAREYGQLNIDLVPLHISDELNVTKRITEEDRIRDHRNALRREAYRRKKNKNVQDKSAHAHNLTDSSNNSHYASFDHDASMFGTTTGMNDADELQGNHIGHAHTLSEASIFDATTTDISDIHIEKEVPGTQETHEQTVEEQKRDRRNALRRAAYRRKKEKLIEKENAAPLSTSDNPNIPNVTERVHEEAHRENPNMTTYTCPAISTSTSSLVDDNVFQVVILNETPQTEQKTEDERRRDHRNALRRASYWRKKEKLIEDENITQDVSQLLQEEATNPPITLHDSDVNESAVVDRRQRDKERKSNLTIQQRDQKNAGSRACYQKKINELTVDVKETRNEKIREKRVQRRRSMSVIEKGESSAQRKANYEKRKNTPCNECIAIPLTDLGNLTSECPASPTRASPVYPGAEDDSSDGDPRTNIPIYTAGADDDVNVFLNGTMGDEPAASELMDEEYYMFRNGSDEDRFDDDDEASMDSATPSEVDPFDSVYSNIPDSTHILKLSENCKHCKARKFVSETDGFCCRNGQIELKQPEPIPELMRLWSSMDADSRHFRENIRFFNGHFAFTTLGVSLDDTYTNMRSGVYTFRAHGSIYHNVHSFGPSSRPEHLQLYFYDDDPNLVHRKVATQQLDQDVVKRLVDILKENPYSQQFRSLGAHKDNLDDYRIDLNTDKRLDQRRYNRPVSSEVAAIWVEGNDLGKRFDRSITLCGNNNERHSIRVTSGAYDPLSYPLFYPMGELGWHPRLPKRNVSWDVLQHPRLDLNDEEDAEGNSRLCVSVRDYYCYMLQTRPAIFNPILCGARLLQQWSVDMYIKIESCRLRWYRKNQTQIRADLYKGVVDAITSGETRASAVGVRIVLPATYPGGDRDMKKRHMDAMSIVHTYGKPDIFLTMTCNPKWEEITDELLPGQSAQDRPDIVARVFYGKLEAMKDMLFKKMILGVVVAYVYVVEFQKRGLPHAHFLLIMDSTYKLLIPEQYDQLISAELPDK